MPESRIESASETPEPVDGVHQEQPVALLDDGGDERLREPDVLGRDALGHAHDRGSELARGARRSRTRPRSGFERLEDLVHQESEQLVDGDVAQELDRELVDDAQRLDELARAARPEAAGRSRSRARAAARPRPSGSCCRADPRPPPSMRTRVVDSDSTLSVTPPTVIRSPGFSDLDGRQPLAVQERAVAGAQVLDREAAVVGPGRSGRAGARASCPRSAGRSSTTARSS